jgi:hypothetical protein
MLLVAGASLVQEDIATGSTGANAAGTSAAGTNSASTGAAGARANGAGAGAIDGASASATTGDIVPAGPKADPGIAIDPDAATAPGTGATSSAESCATDPACVDRYLWSLYERTPKVDTVSVAGQTKVTVTRKGKTRTVTKATSKLVGEDFTWKDPKAAELAGMTPMVYVIGGMDPGFRMTFFRAMRRLDDAGFKPGIMCAFRDDYRQSIATGLKAQNDRSYHGGSFRGGYGHGMAADIVSVRGETREERMTSTGQMWDWIDAHEIELGIGRPYRDRDPPHVGPLDGHEYAEHRLAPRAEAKDRKGRSAKRGADRSEKKNDKRSEAKNDRKNQHADVRSARPAPVAHGDHGDHGAAKHAVMTKPAKAPSKPHTRPI